MRRRRARPDDRCRSSAIVRGRRVSTSRTRCAFARGNSLHRMTLKDPCAEWSRADWKRIGLSGRPPKRDRIFFETRTKLFDSLTNYIDGDLNVVSSEKSAPLVADLRSRCARSAHLARSRAQLRCLFGRSFDLAAKRQREHAKGDFGRMQTAGGSAQIAGAEIHPVAASVAGRRISEPKNLRGRAACRSWRARRC